MAMSENAKKIITFLQANADADYTAADIADALDIKKTSVNSVFTMAIQKKGLGVRVPAEATLEDGTVQEVKLLKLTDAGAGFDVNAVEE